MKGGAKIVFDARHYVVTIVAIFTALGIGLLLGATLLGSDFMVEAQQEYIKELEVTIGSLQSDIEKTKAQLATVEQNLQQSTLFSQWVFPLLVEGALEDTKVAIVYLGDWQLDPGIQDVLRQAGAEVTSVTTVRVADLLSEGLIELMADFFGVRAKLDEVAEGVANSIAGSLGGLTNIDISPLEESGVINLAGNYDVEADWVIVVGGWDQKLEGASVVDRCLVQSLLDTGQQVVGVELSRCAVSSIPVYQRFGVSSVDNVDQVPGRLALVLALQGIKGHFGTKTTADWLLPPRAGEERE